MPIENRRIVRGEGILIILWKVSGCVLNCTSENDTDTQGGDVFSPGEGLVRRGLFGSLL